jgi:formylglycine-generating enzyme required for sulfatase activity
MSTEHQQQASNEESLTTEHTASRAGRLADSRFRSNMGGNTGIKYFLGIAIDEYEHWPQLRNAKRDVQAVAAVLQEKFGYQEEHISLLTDSEASRENIIVQLDAYEACITRQDTLVIYFAGHGHLKKGKKEVGYWVPVDGKLETTASYIPNSTALEHISNINSLHTFVIVDACFSGIMLKRGEIHEEVRNPQELLGRPSRWALCSGRHNEAVDDGPTGEHSPFAGSILRKLRAHQDDYLLVGDLIREVRKVKIQGQQPDGGPLRQLEDEDGGEFAFENVGISKQAADEAVWRMIMSMPEESLIQVGEKRSQLSLFCDTHEGSKHLTEAIHLGEQLEERQAFLGLRNAEFSLRGFLSTFPDSPYEQEVRKRLEAILKTAAPSNPPKVENNKQDSSKLLVLPKKKSSSVTTKKPVNNFPLPEMILVEGGSFDMGCTSEQQDCWEDEQPVHRVTLDSYFIGKYPVTQALWRAVMGTNPSYFKGCDQCPVEQVSWKDVQDFIRRLNERTGQNYRLPTEAEWEYAARGGNKSRHYMRAGGNMIDDIGWYESNSGKKTHPIGQKLANELGLYDMNGNVWEWCNDWYKAYSASAQTNPKGPATGSRRVVRGGSWDVEPQFCRIAIRSYVSPGSGLINVGFRLARSSSPQV